GTIATHTRQFGFTKISFEQQDRTQEWAESCRRKSLEELDWSALDRVPSCKGDWLKLRRLRRALTSLCINSPCFNRCSVFSMHNGAVKAVFGKSYKELNADDEETFKKFEENAERLTCAGCIFSHFVQFVGSSEDFMFNPLIKNFNNTGKDVPYFTEEDFNNDYLYLNKLRARFNYLAYMKQKSDFSLVYISSRCPAKCYIDSREDEKMY
ncbi:MAG: hypothetical protein ACI4VW_08690, partial [Acutalibacteraceae bacterium]